MELYEKLYRLRKEKGITQAELAEQLEVSRQSVSNWEMGTTFPSTKRLKDLSRLYGIPLDDLLNEDCLERDNVSPRNEKSSSESEENKAFTDSLHERQQKSRKRLWIAIVTVLVVVLFILSTVVVVHRLDNKEEDKATYLTEWSNEPFEEEVEGEFNFTM